MRISLWPRSLFGRLIAATVLGVLLAQAVSFYLLARNQQRLVLRATTHMWAEHITAITLLLDQLPASKRAEALRQLQQQRTFVHAGPWGPPGAGRARRLWLGGVTGFASCSAAGPCVMRLPAAGRRFLFRHLSSGLLPPPTKPRQVSGGRSGVLRPPASAGAPPAGGRSAPPRGPPPGGAVLVYRPGPLSRPPPRWRDMRIGAFRAPDFLVRLPFRIDEAPVLAQRLRTDLGKTFHVEIRPATAASSQVIEIPSPMFDARVAPSAFYDVDVRPPGWASPPVFRVARLSPQIPLPRSLVLNLVLLVGVLVGALYVAARGITRPLSRLARAAEAIGQGARAPKLEEKGARELRYAARAFNSMQERLHRYLDSRTRVLAAMSHDLKTPLTRLRLQVETLIEDAAVRVRLGRELDEMEGMVHGALALFRGLDEQEAIEPLDINALLESVREGFVEMGHDVTVTGRAHDPLPGRAQALKRCLTNLVANAVKFGVRARIEVHDGEALRIRVCDDGPGIAPEALERVFEPFYRLESSRNRDTGGTGLGLSIARDVAQAHGGTLTLRNRPQGGLTAELTLPRRPA